MDNSNLKRIPLPLIHSFDETCKVHHHSGNLPCPWPNCPNGIKDDCFLCVTSDFPGHSEEKYIRKSWKALDGSARFSWDNASFFSFLGLSKVIREENIRCQGPNPQFPEIVYHYTNIEALFKIISSNELWLTDYAYMNDLSEINHGLEIAIKILREIGDIPEYSKQIEIIQEWKQVFDVKSVDRICIACFSTDDDNLSQWKGYGGSSTGVCIGLDTGNPSFWYDNSLMLLGKVIYEKTKQIEIIKNIFHIYLTMSEWDKDKKINKFHGLTISPEKGKNYFKTSIMNTLRQFIVFFKNEAFKDEKEIRWVYNENNQLFDSTSISPASKQFRVKGNQIIPYSTSKDLANMEIIGRTNNKQKNYKLPIKQIVVGPQENASRVIAGIKEYLNSFGYNPDIVRPSQVPFRSNK